MTPEEQVIERVKGIETLVEKAATKQELADATKAIADLKKELGDQLTGLQGIVDALNEKQGRILNEQKVEKKSLTELLESEFPKKSEEFAALAQKDSRKHFGFQINAKAVADMSLGNNLTGSNGVPTYRPGIIATPFDPRHFRSLVPTLPSATDLYHYIRHAEAIGEGSIYWQSGENAAKSKRDYDFQDVTVELKPLAGYTKVSRQMLRNLPGLAAYLGQYMPEDYLNAEDAEAYAALAGMSGMTTGNASGGFDGIIKTIGLLGDKKYSVNGIVMRPSMISELLVRKDDYNAYSYPGAINMGTDGTLRIMGVPVYGATWAGNDEAIIGDWRQFAIIQSENLSVRSTDTDQDDFIKNRVTYLMEAVIGFAGFRPAAFSKIDLGFVA
jgi:HK97 family phage major capsid protein